MTVLFTHHLILVYTVSPTFDDVPHGKKIMIWIDEDFREVWKAWLKQTENKLFKKSGVQSCQVGTGVDIEFTDVYDHNRILAFC